MARQGINTGSTPDAGDGDSLLIGALKINENFSEIYTALGDGTNITNSIGFAATAGIASALIPTVNINTSGTITATAFVGDGSGLTGIVGSGSGVVILDDGSTVGTAGTIDFGTNLSVSPISAGVVTVTATGGGGSIAGIDTVGTSYFNQLNVSGISTFSNDVNIKAGNNLVLGSQNQEGGGIIIWNENNHPTSYFQIYNVNNTAYLRNIGVDAGSIIIQSSSNVTLGGGGNSYSVECSGDSVRLFYADNRKFETLGAGVTVTGTTFTNQLSVSGVSTLSSNVSVGGTISVDGGVTLATNNGTIVGTSGTAGEIKQIAGAPFYYDGSAWREFVLSSGTPVTQPADTEWDNVVFRATFDDDFTDAKFGATPVVGSGASIVGAAVTIGTGAFRNTGIGISYAYRDDYDFTGSWTMEFWIYFDSAPQYQGYVSLVSGKNDIDNSGEWSFAFQSGGFGNRYFVWMNENGTNNTLASYSDAAFASVFLDKWNHLALVREGDSGDLHFYVNGTERSETVSSTIIDNDILKISGTGLHIGGAAVPSAFVINGQTINDSEYVDAIFDDMRISAGVGTAGQRYTSIGISTYATFTPPTTALPTSGTLSSVVNPPGDKYGEITLGGSPTWRGTSGVTVSQQSSGNYRVSFASTYTNSNDYYVLSQGMDQGFASYVGIARSTTHVDLSINKQSDDTAVDTGSLAVQIKNHI